MILVPAVIVGPRRSVRGLFALDTGATWTVVTPSILSSAGYAVAEPTRIVSVVTASGTERVGRVAVEAITALGVRSERTEVLAHDLPPALGAHGLLGLDFLRGRKLTIDFRGGTIDLD